MSHGAHGREMGPSGCLEFNLSRRAPIWPPYTCHTCKDRSPWSLLYTNPQSVPDASNPCMGRPRGGTTGVALPCVPLLPSWGLEVEWELRGGPGGRSQKAEGQRWLSALRHHSDGSVSLSGHLQPPPVTTEQHGARYACRIHHPSLPASSGRSAEVTLEVAGLSGPSLEDSIGLFLSAFFCSGSSRHWAGLLSTCPPARIQRRKQSEGTHLHPVEATIISGPSVCSSSPK